MPSNTIVYSVHPSVKYCQTIIANMPVKTGRALDEWVALIEASGQTERKSQTAWLKKNHGIVGTTAGIIVDKTLGEGAENREDAAYLAVAAEYVEKMFSGPKTGLIPIYDTITQFAAALGEDVKFSPCKTIVPFYRNHVFAEIKPSTRTRVDLGLALKGCTKTLSERLIDTGGLAKGDRITHRIAISEPSAFDSEAKAWLEAAYALDA